MFAPLRSLLLRSSIILPLGLGCATQPWAATDEVEGALNRGFPSLGTPHWDVIAGLHDRGGIDITLTVVKLTVLRTDVTPWQEIPLAEAWANPPTKPSTLAVVALRRCASRMDIETYSGEMVDWFMFRDGLLEGFDYYRSGARCVVFDDFQPASIEADTRERELRGWIRREHAQHDRHRRQVYARGLAYLEVGRVDAAEEMLTEGDATFDASDRGNITRFDGRRPGNLVTESDRDIATTRERLVAEIKSARARGGPQLASVDEPEDDGSSLPAVSLAGVQPGAMVRNRAEFQTWFKVLSAPRADAVGNYEPGAIRARNRRTGRILDTSAAAVLAGQTGWNAQDQEQLGTYVEREWQSSTFYGGAALTPDWLPLYPTVRGEALNLHRTEGDTPPAGGVLLETEDPAQTVDAYYEGALRGAGFGRTSDELGDTHLLTAIHPDGRKVRVTTAPDGLVTVVVLEWSQ